MSTTTKGTDYIDSVTGLVIGAVPRDGELATVSVAEELAAGRPLPEVGDVVALFSRGRVRAVRVTKVGRKNITGEYASPTAIEEGRERAVGYVARTVAELDRYIAGSEESIARYERELANPALLMPEDWERERLIDETSTERTFMGRPREYDYATVEEWRVAELATRPGLIEWHRDAIERKRRERIETEELGDLTREELTAKLTTVTSKSQAFDNVYRFAGDTEEVSA